MLLISFYNLSLSLVLLHPLHKGCLRNTHLISQVFIYTLPIYNGRLIQVSVHTNNKIQTHSSLSHGEVLTAHMNTTSIRYVIKDYTP